MLRLCRLLIRAGLRQVSTVQNVPSWDGIGGRSRTRFEFILIQKINAPKMDQNLNTLSAPQWIKTVIHGLEPVNPVPKKKIEKSKTGLGP